MNVPHIGRWMSGCDDSAVSDVGMVVGRTLVCVGLLFLALSARGGDDARAAFSPEQVEFFEKQVRPILVEHCFECHSGRVAEPKGGLRLDSRQAVLRGGDTGPAAVPGQPEKSLLIDAINYGDLYQMPPKSQLPPEMRHILTQWVRMGLPWGPEPQHEQAERRGQSELDVLSRASSQWAWQPMQHVPPPFVRDSDWPRDPLDSFILAKLEAAGLAPAKEVSRAEWLRRVTFDLTGLPPTPEEFQEFLADPSDTAFARVADRLLASPRFAERWARHWLDLVRYAESRGHEFDYDIPNAYEYRDYVIRALQHDVPYDQFVREHIAGDLLVEPRLHPVYGWNESVLGTGFWYLGEWVHSPVDIRKDECDRQDNMLDVFGKTFLALTISCARCHEHKFDPITQRDYYALAGFLRSSTYRQVHFEQVAQQRVMAERLANWQMRTDQELSRQFGRQVSERRLLLENIILVAARAFTQAYPLSQGNASPHGVAQASDVWQQVVTQTAQQEGVDKNWLERWVQELRTAATNPQHLLYPLAQAAVMASHPTGPEQLVDSSPLAAWRQAEMMAVAERQAAWRASFVVWDAERIGSHWPDWMTDGFAYGPGPQRAGSWVVDEPSARLRCAGYTAARAWPAWSRLRRSEAVDGEPGRLAAWDRAGKVLRTATFELQDEPLHYLVRGSGLAYVVVDSHRMINGPLHGNLLKEFRIGGGLPQWVTHDLRRYAGHTAHVEFHPLDGEPLEILSVVQSSSPPGWPLQTTRRWLAEQFVDPTSFSPDKLVSCYVRIIDAVQRHFLDHAAEDLPGEVIAEWTNWFLERPWLLDQERNWYEPLATILADRHGEYHQLVANIPLAGRTAPAMWDGNGADEYLLIRGNPRAPAERVPRRFLAAWTGTDDGPRRQEGSGRLELAEQLVDPQNPFLARVYVNRLWQHLMGRGIVASVDNFGALGEAPSHPELLDYLAVEFVNSGWSTKALLRRIVLSSTYRMSSHLPEQRVLAVDPENRLWHRMPLKRMEGEVLRDTLLCLSGRLDTTMYGRSVPTYLTPFMQGRGRPSVQGPLDGAGRRTIYLAVRRNFLSPMMLAFDMPQPFSTVGRRSVSNVPAQALILMNDPFVVEQAQRWATRLLDSHQRCAHPSMFEAAVTRAYQEAFTRNPEPQELQVATSFFREQGHLYGISWEQAIRDRRVWSDYCHALWNAKEFLYIP